MNRTASMLVTTDAQTQADAVPAQIGAKIRQMRRSLGMSLQTLSDRTGISIGSLSQIERGISSPSLKHLVALGSVMGVRTSWFFDEEDPAQEDERSLIVRRERRKTFTMKTGSNISKELLSPSRDSMTQIYMLRLDPGGDTGEKPYSHPGEVQGYVVSGNLNLWLNTAFFILREGDSFLIPPNSMRRFLNPDSKVSTELIWSISHYDRV